MSSTRARPRPGTGRWILFAALLALGVMVFWPGTASAVDPTSASITVTKTVTDTGYIRPGGTIHYKYEVTATQRFTAPVVTDDKCASVVPTLAADGIHNIGDTGSHILNPPGAPDGFLNGLAGEKWEYTCEATAPSAPLVPSTLLTNTATVTANFAPVGQAVDGQYSDTDSFTLEALVLRKAVFIFWNYNTGIVDPDAAGVVFKVDVKKNGTTVGTEDLTVNAPLSFWLTPGNWTFQEQTPPTGYEIFDSRGTWNTDLSGYLDNTFIDRSDFDLSITKSGSEWAYGGDSVTYTYEVKNTGPAAVTPVVTDDKCSPVNYDSGDTSGDGKIQADETWKFTCTTTPDWDGVFNAGSPWALTNTATVVADEADDLEPAYEGGPIFGGDTNASNDTSSFTLYAFVLRKNVGLPNDTNYPDFNAFSDNTPFQVEMYLDNSLKTTFTISENSPKYLWLAGGTWKFTEINLPTGYTPFYPGGTITVTLPDGYTDWSELNLAPWSGCSLGYWKTHTDNWPSPYTPGDDLKPPFAYFTGNTFLTALGYPGGSGIVGGQQILLKQAVAALLNEAEYGTAFGPYATEQALIDAVNTALNSDNRTTMINLASNLDTINNGVCR